MVSAVSFSFLAVFLAACLWSAEGQQQALQAVLQLVCDQKANEKLRVKRYKCAMEQAKNDPQFSRYAQIIKQCRAQIPALRQDNAFVKQLCNNPQTQAQIQNCGVKSFLSLRGKRSPPQKALPSGNEGDGDNEDDGSSDGPRRGNRMPGGFGGRRPGNMIPGGAQGMDGFVRTLVQKCKK